MSTQRNPLFPAELVLEVQAIAADRHGVADAPAGQAVGRAAPVRGRRLTAYRRLGRAERAVVAEARRDRRRAADRARTGAICCRLPLARAVGAEADAPRPDGTAFGPPIETDGALRVVAKPPASLQQTEI